MRNDPGRLRTNAGHFRRLAKILTDPAAAAELLEIAGEWDARAAEIEAERQERKRWRSGLKLSSETKRPDE